MAFWNFLKSKKKIKESTWQEWRTKPNSLQAWGLAPQDGVLKLEFCLPRFADKDPQGAAQDYVTSLALEWLRVESYEALPVLDRWSVLVRSPKSVSLASLAGVRPESQVRVSDSRPLMLVGLTLGERDSWALERVWSRKGYGGEAGLEAHPQLRTVTLRRVIKLEPLLGKLMKLRAQAILVSAAPAQSKNQEKTLVEAVTLIKESKTSLKDLPLYALAWDLKETAAQKWGYQATFDQKAKPSEIAKTILLNTKH